MPEYVARVIVRTEYDVTVNASDVENARVEAEASWDTDGETIIEEVIVDSVDLSE